MLAQYKYFCNSFFISSKISSGKPGGFSRFESKFSHPTSRRLIAANFSEFIYHQFEESAVSQVIQFTQFSDIFHPKVLQIFVNKSHHIFHKSGDLRFNGKSCN